MPEKPEPGCGRGVFGALLKEWILEHKGVDFFNSFKASLTDFQAAILENADRAAWYPVKDSFAIHERLYEILGEEAHKEVVRTSIRKSISGFLKGLASFASPITLARRASAFWSRMYSSGRMETEKVSSGEFNVTVYDWKEVEFGCYVVGLWLEEMIKLTGVKKYKLEKTCCVHKGAEFCRWNIKLA
ncbi:hypothetical protein GX441_08845 [bacterium]|nr:hypothetical protein [bacterium]